MTEVRLVEAPVALCLASLEHLDSLLREVRLIAADIEVGRARRVSISMAQGIEDLLSAFADVRAGTAAQAEAAAARSETVVDIVFDVPSRAAVMAAELLELLNEADAWARRGVLLTEAAPPDVVGLRHWICQEIALQTAGAEPSAFPAPTGGVGDAIPE